MKKFSFGLILALVFTVFLFDGCKKDKSNNCSELLEAVDQASTAFTTNPSQATCEAYYDAIRDYYDGCDLIPSISKAFYDAWLESANCTGY